MQKQKALRIYFLFLGLFIIFGHTTVTAFDWKTYESEHFVIFYPAGYEYQAKETAYYLEQQLPKIQELTGNVRKFKTEVVLQDIGIESNGYANPWMQKIGIFTHLPATESGLAFYQNWFRLVNSHELTHLGQLTNYSGFGSVLPKIFGDFMSPNIEVPDWLIEGIAVYSESQVSEYEGRLNDGYYDAILASKAASGKFPNILEASYRHAHYPNGQWYLYGGTFLRYLAESYSEEKLTAFFIAQGKHPIGVVGAITPYLGIDLAAKKVFGKGFTQLFKEWQEAEELEHLDWKITGKPVITTNRNYIQNLFSYEGKLYYTEQDILTPYPTVVTKVFNLVEYDPALQTRKVLKTHNTNISFQIRDKTIYYTVQEMMKGFANVDQNGYGRVAIFYNYDLETGETTGLFTAEVKTFLPLDHDEIIYTVDRKDGYGADIWKYTNGIKEKVGTINQNIAEMLEYEDKFVIVSKPNGGSWNINYLDPITMAVTPIIDSPWTECAIAIEDDLLYYTANYQGKYAIYEYDLVLKGLAKLTDGGYAFNGVSVRNELFFKGITPNGDAIFKTEFNPVPSTLPESEVIKSEDFEEFAQSLKRDEALGKNLSYLLKPYMRFFPNLLEAEDGLGLNTYSVTYSGFTSVDFNFTSRALMPLTFSIGNFAINKEERQTVLAGSYPLHVSKVNPVSNISLAGYTNFQNNYVIGVGLLVNKAHEFFTGTLYTNLGARGWDVDLGYQYLLENGALLLKGSYVDNFYKDVDLGYSTIHVGGNEQAKIFSADFVHKIAEVRKGFWPLNLFLVDIYGNIFTDYVKTESGKTSYGIELLCEVDFGYSNTIVPRLGVTMTDTGLKQYLGFKTEF